MPGSKSPQKKEPWEEAVVGCRDELEQRKRHQSEGVELDPVSSETGTREKWFRELVCLRGSFSTSLTATWSLGGLL